MVARKYPTLMKPEESAECHETLSSQVGSGHENTLPGCFVSSLWSLSVCRNGAIKNWSRKCLRVKDLYYYPLMSTTNTSPSFSSCSAPLRIPQPVINTPLRRAEKGREEAFRSSSRWPLMQSWCNWETSSNRGTMRSVSPNYVWYTCM